MEEISLRELIEVLLKRKWFIICITLAAVLISGIVSFYVLSPVYEATEVLNIRGGEKAAAPEMTELDMDMLLEQLSRIPLYDIETYRQQILSYPFLEELISSLQHLKGTTPATLRKSIIVEQVPDTNLMKISVRNRDPVLVAEVANKISKLFIQQNNAHNQEQFAKFTSFLLEQMEEKQEQLDAIMREYRDFLKQPRSPAPPGARGSSSIMENNGVLQQSSEGDELKEELNFKTASLTGYKTALIDLKIRLATTRQEKESLERQLHETAPTIVTERSLVDDSLLLQVAAAKSEGENFERLAGLQFQSEEVNPVYLELEAGLKNKNVEIDALSKEMEKTTEAIVYLENELTGLRGEYLEKWREREELEKEITYLESSLERLEDRYVELQMVSSLAPEKISFTVVSPAYPPENPIKPRKMLNIAIAGVLGLMASVFMAFFLYYWETSQDETMAKGSS